jgi:hypothetical protein
MYKKRCRACGLTLPIDEFYVRTSGCVEVPLQAVRAQARAGVRCDAVRYR